MAFDFDEKLSENVVDLIEKPEEDYVKSPRYRSIHSKRNRIEFYRSKSAHKTLGRIQIQPSDPRNFLRKHSGQEKKKKKSSVQLEPRHVHYRRPDYVHQLPKWTLTPKPPRRSVTALPPLPSDPIKRSNGINFCKKNIEIVKNLKPKTIVPKYVDTKRGDAHDLSSSGLLPIYIYKKNFGKAPENIIKNSSKVLIDKKLEDKKPLCRYIVEDEREQLLKKLKIKLEETMKQFQCLPFIIDSVAKRKRKISLEEKLKQLEQDIGLIENHRYIYIYDDYV